ncbi:MAG: type II secretion system inner membrane protein GspF [Candidatus Competibacterales bacterium]|nr:type II secretion system inner membrane protein GspF [Candidatus Competibacterales bacterium]
MPAFHYQALDAAGRSRKGLLEGDTARQVRQQLRGQGLTPVAVSEVGDRPGARRSPARRGLRLGAAERVLVMRQLATLIGAGLPIEQALAGVARESERPRVGGLLLALRARVTEGHALAAAIAEFPRAFPEIYQATVAAGEQSGHLALTLERLADYAEARQQLQQKIGLALIYPLLLTLVAGLIVAGLLAYVVPQVVQVFANTRQTLPWLTRALIALSNGLRDHGGWLLLGLAVAGLGGGHVLRRPAPRLALHHALLRLPLAGRLIRAIQSARFARTLSILLASGVPMLEALRIGTRVLTSLPLQRAAERAAVRVREGSGLHDALAAEGGFPPLLLQLIASGEASGRLEAMLARAAEQQERDTEIRVATLLGLFEPLLILVMGTVVLLIVLAILLPIFELNQLVR